MEAIWRYVKSWGSWLGDICDFIPAKRHAAVVISPCYLIYIDIRVITNKHIAYVHVVRLYGLFILITHLRTADRRMCVWSIVFHWGYGGKVLLPLPQAGPQGAGEGTLPDIWGGLPSRSVQVVNEQSTGRWRPKMIHLKLSLLYNSHSACP